MIQHFGRSTGRKRRRVRDDDRSQSRALRHSSRGAVGQTVVGELRGFPLFKRRRLARGELERRRGWTGVTGAAASPGGFEECWRPALGTRVLLVV